MTDNLYVDAPNLRDYFAAAALAAVGTGRDVDDFAETAYHVADAMLRERDNR